ncbi:cysteine hydrolase family protein [Chitinophaga nivalis]|uniref:Cysteine hydrolase n=1 Tax=Chitinophaga nivalis TaxID=2991709 RepID=A0ABT3IK95_9BACT|nr:cysteine hydrolase family protein [Chitinophaga nivalis]MCW3465936.1 cysteine hydrolase [Chitinophaga nivalis]MCW3484373.1 cysteine hydrolase [Chitinophaga nivalis]
MKTALLIIDVQNDYFEGGAHTLVNAAQAGQQVQQVLQTARKQQLPVVHIQHLAVNEGADFFLPNTTGAHIHACANPLPGETVITKNYPNSFRATTLLAHLQEHHITHLVICGMMTDVCVDATVRAAMDLGFTTTVIGDACATRNRELYGQTINADTIHQAYLAGMTALGGLYAQVIPAATFMA